MQPVRHGLDIAGHSRQICIEHAKIIKFKILLDL